jgi:threonine synthase
VVYCHRHTFKITYKYQYCVASLKAGGTPLRRSIEYCGRCSGASVYVKDESKNPFGTFKDRRCAAVLESHREKKELVLVHITSGNSGYSLGMMAKGKEAEGEQKMTVVNVVPKGLPKPILRMLRKCSEVQEMDLGTEIITQERLAKIARKKTGFVGSDDCIVGVEDYGLGNGYRSIIKEICGSGVKPTHIFCPVGEGELAVELAAEAENVWGDEAPKIVGVTIKENIFARGKVFLKSPGKSIADKLVNGYSKFRELLNRHVQNGRATIVVATEREIASEYAELEKIGIGAEPSAAAAFSGAVKYNLTPNDTVVIVNTGKGVYDHGAVDKLWRRRLVNAARYLAVAAVSIAITAGAFLWKNYVEREKQFLELQRQELVMQVEYETLGRIRAEAKHTLDSNGDGDISYEEIGDLFRVLPDRKGNSATPGLGHYDHEIGNFTEEELRYYLTYTGYEQANGNIEQAMMRTMRERYLEKRRGSYERGPTIGERTVRIWNFRHVEKQDGTSSPFCGFREFDVNNPFDPSKEKLCPQ